VGFGARTRPVDVGAVEVGAVELEMDLRIGTVERGYRAGVEFGALTLRFHAPERTSKMWPSSTEHRSAT